ncbi:MAG: recombinase family protein [Candidatus Micrarchaeota archaeon]|nr:recombinase family protein [Candidatus Micrarchaeota archaeon]
MKVALYVRVSDMKLKEDGTRRQDIERQVELLRGYCATMHYDAPESLIYRDDGKSAWTDDLNSRPAFKQMRADMLMHKFDKVIVESLDRFSSNLAQGLDWLSEYSRNNIHVISLQSGEHEVTTDEGWAKSAMFLMFAEYRIRNLRSKVISGMERRRNKETAICGACGVVHVGRHPQKCLCKECVRKHPERAQKKGGV